MTTLDIELPQELKAQALQYATYKGISLEQFIQEALKQSLREFADLNMADDPFLVDNAVFTGETPADLAENHDGYLYGENQ